MFHFRRPQYPKPELNENDATIIIKLNLIYFVFSKTVSFFDTYRRRFFVQVQSSHVFRWIAVDHQQSISFSWCNGHGFDSVEFGSML